MISNQYEVSANDCPQQKMFSNSPQPSCFPPFLYVCNNERRDDWCRPPSRSCCNRKCIIKIPINFTTHTTVHVGECVVVGFSKSTSQWTTLYCIYRSRFSGVSSRTCARFPLSVCCCLCFETLRGGFSMYAGFYTECALWTVVVIGGEWTKCIYKFSGRIFAVTIFVLVPKHTI